MSRQTRQVTLRYFGIEVCAIICDDKGKDGKFLLTGCSGVLDRHWGTWPIQLGGIHKPRHMKENSNCAVSLLHVTAAAILMQAKVSIPGGTEPAAVWVWGPAINYVMSWMPSRRQWPCARRADCRVQCISHETSHFLNCTVDRAFWFSEESLD
jgi:hypothetical protein